MVYDTPKSNTANEKASSASTHDFRRDFVMRRIERDQYPSHLCLSPAHSLPVHQGLDG